MEEFKIILSQEEKVECINEIIKKLKKIIYVYEKSQEENTSYNYKIFIKGLIFYISSANYLFNGKLINIIINLNSIILNDFDKKQLKSVVFEAINNAQYLLEKEKGENYDL